MSMEDEKNPIMRDWPNSLTVGINSANEPPRLLRMGNNKPDAHGDLRKKIHIHTHLTTEWRNK